MRICCSVIFADRSGSIELKRTSNTFISQGHAHLLVANFLNVPGSYCNQRQHGLAGMTALLPTARPRRVIVQRV
jgi:hypothetical protein